MKIRAIIFDVYGTLLRVGPRPADAAARWRALFLETFQCEPPMDLLGFSIACNQVIKARHATAQAQGVRYPEVLWPKVIGEVLPQFTKLNADTQAAFVLEHMQLGRTISLMPGAGPMLRKFVFEKRLLGIASNSQAYSLAELEKNLAGEQLDLKIFDPQLCFWSFQHGFSKPDPHVFQILGIRLEARGVKPAETLVVGDNEDNDVQPARACGFQTWHLNGVSAEKTSGDWNKLDGFLSRNG